MFALKMKQQKGGRQEEKEVRLQFRLVINVSARRKSRYGTTTWKTVEMLHETARGKLL